ncbi:MAG TPA: hypothetical protein VGL56_15055 [Fimbriimonadaceae bacterium]|jgi:hypothetical protein
MDYQAWLKVFSVELSHQKPGVAIDDLDPLYLQTLYQKGVGPVQAVNKALVLRGYRVEGDNGFFAKVRWHYLIPAAALLLVGFVVMQSKKSISDQEIVTPSVIHTYSAPKTQGDFFALGDISYWTPGSSNFRQATGRPSRNHDQIPIRVANQISDEPALDNQPIGPGGDSSVSSAASGAVSVSLDIPATKSATISRNGGGGSNAATANPDLQSFQVNVTGQDYQGYSGEVTWNVTNGQSVQLYLNGQAISGATTLVGNLPFSGLQEGAIFNLRVINNGKVAEQTGMVEPANQ